MFLIPFISRLSHDAIVSAKNAEIALLREKADFYRDRCAEIAASRDALDDKLVKALETCMQPPVRRQRGEQPEPERQPATLDLAMVDPNDNEMLALIVKRELPPGARVSATHVMQAVRRLREQVIQAHTDRVKGSSSPVLVPKRVDDKIQAAIDAGAKLAQGA